MGESLIQDYPKQTSGDKAAGSAQVQRSTARRVEVALLTGGMDKDYALCLASALIAEGVFLDFIGSDEVNAEALVNTGHVNSLNLRGEQDRNAGSVKKLFRVLRYYARLIGYAATARPRVFHVLWNNKFQFFDRTALMLYYKLLGKRITFTAHNVNAGKRDLNDSFANRLSLKIQYQLADQIFLHTEKMKAELLADFGVPDRKATVIPYGLYNNLPNTKLTCEQARQSLGLGRTHKVLLFFGNLAPYKGLEFLVDSLAMLNKKDPSYRLIIAGAVNDCADYWARVQETMTRNKTRDQAIERIGYVPAGEVERYFKAADVCVLPYTHIFQSGVLFLSYSFGLPVVATDVGSLQEEIIEGKTGLVCPPKDPVALAAAIESYFASDLYRDLENRRIEIRRFAEEGHSWAKVGAMTKQVYSQLADN